MYIFYSYIHAYICQLGVQSFLFNSLPVIMKVIHVCNLACQYMAIGNKHNVSLNKVMSLNQINESMSVDVSENGQ